jgi:hypothetical protein
LAYGNKKAGFERLLSRLSLIQPQSIPGNVDPISVSPALGVVDLNDRGVVISSVRLLDDPNFAAAVLFIDRRSAVVTPIIVPASAGPTIKVGAVVIINCSAQSANRGPPSSDHDLDVIIDRSAPRHT